MIDTIRKALEPFAKAVTGTEIAGKTFNYWTPGVTMGDLMEWCINARAALSSSSGYAEGIEAAAKDAAERASTNSGAPPQLLYAPILFALKDYARSLSPTTGERTVPAAWMRGVHSPGTPNGPDEYDYDISAGEDQPDGKGWFPLYRHPATTGERESIVAFLRAKAAMHTEQRDPEELLAYADAIERGEDLKPGAGG